MMNYQTVNWMMGGFGSGAYLFMWLTSVLTVILLILGIVALWKYINKK